MSLVDVERLRGIAESEFADIVTAVIIPDLNEHGSRPHLTQLSSLW